MRLHRVAVVLVFSLVAHVIAPAQAPSLDRGPISVAAGFGVSWVDAPDVNEFINDLGLQSRPVPTFVPAIVGFASVSYRIGSSMDIKFEEAYMYRSYDFPQAAGPDASIAYGVQLPTLLLHYLAMGERASLKVGGGMGYHTAWFSEESVQGAGRWTSKGVGIKIEVEVQTAFDEHLFSYLELGARKEFMSDLKDGSGVPLMDDFQRKPVGLGFLSGGLEFGLTYWL